MSTSLWTTWAVFGLDFILRLFFCLRVIQRRLPVGVIWAWLCLILFLPVFGTVLYLYLGEYRMGRHRYARLAAASKTLRDLVHTLFPKNTDDVLLKEPLRPFVRAVRGFFHSPLLAGNNLELLRGADEAFPRMIADIDQAQSFCVMEFYIWSDGGRADAFGEALIRAAGRGVRCRILVDQIGSAEFLRGPMAKKLKRAGVELKAALPSGLFRSFFARPDLRIHRKIFIVDGAIGYTGSLNLADPVMFKRDAGVGQWVDAFCRMQGPAVEALAFVFFSDWSVETGTDVLSIGKEFSFKDTAKKKTALVQVLPSGPAFKNSAIEEVLNMAIYSARRELVLTTPYFVPSESMMYAFITAAKRGVDVTLIVPARVDSRVTQYASRAFMKELVEAGVRVALYKGGMLHTKSVLVDGEFSLFGSFNLDPRSLRINFEVGLAIYDTDFSQALRWLQEDYLRQSDILDLAACNAPHPVTHFIEDLARLAGPLL